MSTRATATFEPGSAPPSAALGRLVVVSNRVPAPERSDGRDRNTPVGGLVGAVAPGLQERGGPWFGWSGRSTQRRPDTTPALSQIGEINLATIDLSEDDVSLFYTGFANRTMWPLLHSFTDRTVIQHSTYRAYERINRRFAEALYPMLEAGDMVWVRDQEHGKPLAVGQALVSGDEMVSMTKGKAIQTLHWVGDELWDLET